MKKYICTLILLFLTSDQSSKVINFTTLDILLSKATAFRTINQFDSALIVFEQIKELSLATSQLTTLASTYDNIGYINSLLKNYSKAKQAYLNAIKIYLRNDNYETLISLYLRIGYIHRKLQLYSKSLENYQTAQSYLKKIHEQNQYSYDSLNALIFYQKARINQRLSKSVKSLSIFHQAKQSSSKLKSSNLTIKIVKGLGRSYQEIGDYNQAIEYYIEVSEYQKKQKEVKSLSNTYNSIAILYKDLKNWAKALAYYRKSLSLRFDLNDTKKIARSYNNIGSLYLATNELDSSVYYLRKSLLMRQKLNYHKSIPFTFYNLGEAYLKMEQLDSAQHYLTQSLSSQKETSNFSLLAGIYNQLSRLNLKKRQFNTAQTHWNKAYQLAQKHQIADAILDIYKTGIALNQAKKDYQTALTLANRKELVKDSLYRKQRLEVQEVFHANQLEQKETEKQLETARADAEARVSLFSSGLAALFFVLVLTFIYLWIINRRQKRLKQELYDALNHRSRNDFQILDAEIQYRLDKLVENPKSQAIYLQHMIQALNLGYKAFSSGAVKQGKSIQDFVTQLAMGMQGGYGHKAERVNFDFDIQSIQLEMNQLTALGFILVELLTNAFKHAFDAESSDPTIRLSVKETNGTVIVTFEDNGKGLSATPQAQTHSGEGLKELEALAKQLQGTFSHRPQVAGCSFILQFPLNS